MNSSSSFCFFYQLQGSCSAGDQCPFSHASQDTASRAASNGPLADSEGTQSQTERGNKQTCYFWKQGRCKKGNQCYYAHTDTVQAEDQSSTQHSPPSSSASSDDGDVSSVNSQEDQPRDDKTCIDNTGEDMTHEDVEEQPLQQGDLSSTDSEQVASDVSEKDATGVGTEALDLLSFANDEQNDGNEEPERVESPVVEASIGDVVDQMLNSDHNRGEGALTCQSGSERSAENVASTDQLKEEGDRSLETVTPDDHVHEGGSATLDNTAEPDDRDDVLVQGHDTRRDHQANMANDDDHVPHWTEYADPYANPFVAFCSFFARGRCKENMNCTYRHALTVQEYLLLFRVEPVIWSQYVQDDYSDPPLFAKHPTSQRPCIFYPLGKCRNGDNCPYTHDPDCSEYGRLDKRTTGLINNLVPGYDENNYEESGLSYNENEQIGWSSRQQRPCKYFVNGSCKFSERCEFSHDINDLNSNLVNNVESQDNEWNSWNQAETDDWGAANNPLSNEGHTPESGINDGNAKNRPADEEEPTKLNEKNIDDRWGGQWGNGSATATQWTDLNSATSERSQYNGSGSSRNGFSQSERGGRIVKTCRYFALGTCRKVDCRFEHPKNDFVRNDRGGNGTYVTQHDTWNTSSNDQKAWNSEANYGWRDGNMESDRTSQVSGQKVCWSFAQGGCTRLNCRFLHEANEPTNSNINWNTSGSQPDAWDNPQSENQNPNAASRNDKWAETNFGENTPPRRRQEPCMCFGQGFCKMGANCPMLYDNPDGLDEGEVQEDNINDTNLVNNAESQDNEWNQTETVDWGGEKDSLSNEGHAPESGIDDGNAKDRPADEEEPTKLNEQNIDDSGQWENDNAAETQRGDDNAAATQWGDNNLATPERSEYNESGSSRNSFSQSEQGDRSVKTCRYFALGTCRKTDCRFAHQRNDSVPNDRGSNGTHVAQHDTWNTSSNDQKALQSKANDGRRGGNMESDRILQVNGQICWYFTRGGCTRPNCKFLHESNEPMNSNMNSNTRGSQPDAWDNPQSEAQDPNAASWNDNWLETNFSSSYVSNTPPRRRQELCMYFGQGFCNMGANCPMLHVNPDNPNGLDDGEIQEEPEKQDRVHYDADNQTERSIFNCTVAFGAGCWVPRTLTATDPTQVILSDLPPNFSPEELNNTNIDGLRDIRLDDSRDIISAILEFESPQDTLRSFHRLHGYVLRNSTLSARMEYPIESEKDSKLYEVMITWPSPSKVAWARYPSVTLAKDNADRLDGQMFDGRKVQASYITAKKTQKDMFSVQISNLPQESSAESIKQLCNECQFVNMTKPTYTTSPIEHIKELLTKQGDLVDFDAPDLPPCEESFLAFARFGHSEDAAAAIAAFHKLKDDSVGAEGSYKAKAVNHVRFKIPSNQFQYIREDLEKLRDSHQQQCTTFFVRSTINVDNMDIYAFAAVNDSPAFMKLLTSLNSLVNGEVLMQDGNAVWDDYFHMSSSVKAIETANTEYLQQYNVLVMPDRRTQQITILGEVLNRPRAKDCILKIIKKVRVAWNEVPFERIFVRWYLEQGRDQIQSDSDIGQNKVSVDLTAPKLVVRGDAKVLTKVKEYMRAAVTIPDNPSNLAYDDVCHICIQKAISSVRLPCKHCYCKECLTALLSFAVESHSMPLQCIADTAADSNNTPCSKDIPYPVIRDLLPMAVEEQLLRSRFLSHVRSDAKQLFFCPTPNCETVHRYREGGANLHCPTCLNEVCSSCQTRSHPGAGCKEWLESIDRI